MANNGKKIQSNLDAEVFKLLLDRTSVHSLQAQLINALRDMLISGRDYSGARLPASRKLSEELSVSRTTVTSAYDQLLSEGYLVTQIGGGTFVAAHLPHLTPPAPKTGRDRDLPHPWLPFHPGVPDQSLFPHRNWARHLERAWRRPDTALLARPDPFGWYPLREAITDHLSLWRGLECRPEQIMITSGAWEAFDVIFSGLLEGGQTAAIEDPGWPQMQEAIRTTGTHVQPIRIDGEGFDAARIKKTASIAIVTPSRHYPTGTSMPLVRRMSLLDWAQCQGGLIVEDDYDSEFRYQGHPLPSLAGLDGLKRSIYLGSFSKLLSPALRIGYMVLPDAYLKSAKNYVSRVGARASLVPQPALATFMDGGEFAVHLRRMRRTYAKRLRHLVSELSLFDDLLGIAPDPSGMHLCTGLLPNLSKRTTDRAIVEEGKKRGIFLRSLSSQSILPSPPQGLILGYAAFDESQLTQAVRKLGEILGEIRR